nr:fibronectin type III domain-containing protein [Micromonospora sp. DSM 115978]
MSRIRLRAAALPLVAALLLVLGPLATPAAAAQTTPLTPLGAPGQPVVSELTPISALLTWSPSTGPVFRYSMKRLVDGEWQGYASMPSTSFRVGLTPGATHTFAVYSVALPFSGYTASPLSEPVTVMAPPAR